MLSNEVHCKNCKRVGLFFENVLLDRFCSFVLEHSLTFQVTFSRFRSSFLNDLYCSYSEVKLVAKIKAIAASKY